MHSLINEPYNAITLSTWERWVNRVEARLGHSCDRLDDALAAWQAGATVADYVQTVNQNDCNLSH